MLVSDWSGVSTGALEFNDFKQQAHKLEFTFYPDRLKYDSAEGATVSFNVKSYWAIKKSLLQNQHLQSWLKLAAAHIKKLNAF